MVSFTAYAEPNINLRPGDTVKVYLSNMPPEINYLEIFFGNNVSVPIIVETTVIGYNEEGEPIERTVYPGLQYDAVGWIAGGWVSFILPDRWWVAYPFPWGATPMKIKAEHPRTPSDYYARTYWAYFTIDVPAPILTLIDEGYAGEQLNIIYRYLGGVLSSGGGPYPNRRIALLAVSEGVVGEYYTASDGGYLFRVGFSKGETHKFISTAAALSLYGDCVANQPCVKSELLSVVFVAAPSSATVTVRGKCTGGYPTPSMLLAIYEGGVPIKSKTISVVSIGSVYEDSIVVTGAGGHWVHGRMVLTNPLGSYELLTSAKTFTLG